MAYRLKPGESIPRGIERIVKKEFESALDRLSGENHCDPGVVVHESRKSVKKIRAVLRLFRAELGGRYASENRKLQAVGRKLSELRDAAVMVEVFDQLNRKYPGELSKRTIAGIRGGLITRKNQVYRATKDGKLLADVSSMLHACLDGFQKMPLELDGFRAIAPGIETTFRRARQAMKYARKQPQPENFHEWRKRVKDHWYLTRLFFNPPGHPIRAQQNLKKLETWLGDDHNLAVLREKTIGQPGLEALIDRYQTELRKTGLALGEQIYQERPRVFTRRMKDSWSIHPAEPEHRTGRSNN